MDLLFQDASVHRDTVVATLASGSRGNCTFIGDDRRGVLIDCGVSALQVLARLDRIGLGDVRIEAVLLTHEHSDHVAAARVLDARLERRQGRPVPFFSSRGTMLGLDHRVRPRAVTEVRSGEPFLAGGFTIEPYAVPHDTRDPLAYLVEHRGTTVGVVTDLGRSTRLVEHQLARMHVAVLEFNHDVEMLLDGSYPWSLKQRVKGPHGHLSNEQAAELLRSAASERLRHVVLAHLSEENNRPALALEAAEGALRDAGRVGVTVSVAGQDAPLPPIRVAASPVAPRPRRAAPSPASPAHAPSPQLGLFATGSAPVSG